MGLMRESKAIPRLSAPARNAYCWAVEEDLRRLGFSVRTVGEGRGAAAVRIYELTLPAATMAASACLLAVGVPREILQKGGWAEDTGFSGLFPTFSDLYKSLDAYTAKLRISTLVAHRDDGGTTFTAHLFKPRREEERDGGAVA